MYSIPLLFVALHPSRSSAALFTFGYVADDARSLTEPAQTTPESPTAAEGWSTGVKGPDHGVKGPIIAP